MGKLSKDRRDIYYRKAKESGYRARSSFKLIQINEKFEILKLFNPNKYKGNLKDIINIYNKKYSYNIIDLCAAPGSWSQVLKNICLFNYYQILNLLQNKQYIENDFINNFSLYINYNDELENKINNLKKYEYIKQPNIISVDLQEMGKINYVNIIQGDITKLSTFKKIYNYIYQNKYHNINNNINNNIKNYVDIVVCDGAPDITGMNDVDEFIQSQLILSSLKVCFYFLNKGGNLISKIFRGEHTGLLIMHFNKYFEKVYICKPQSSRNKSLESFLVCLNFLINPYIKLNINFEQMSNEEIKNNDKYILYKYYKKKKNNKIKDLNIKYINNENKENKEKNEIENKEKEIDDNYNNIHNNLLKNEIYKKKNYIDVFNFYYSDSDEEIKYFNSEDENIINDYIASKNFKTEKFVSFVSTQNYYDSDKSYLLPNNYIRHEPQLKPLNPPYLLALKKKRNEEK